MQMDADVSFETLATVPTDSVSYIRLDFSNLITLAEETEALPG